MRRIKFAGLRFVLFGAVWVGIMGLVTFALWNTIVPSVFHLNTVNYWQALGLIVLSRILFGRFGSGMRKPHFVRGWKGLTPDERKRFRRAVEPYHTGNFGDGERVP